MPEDYTEFDIDVIIHINSVFNILEQMGVGPVGGYFITDKDNTWSEYLKDLKNIEMVKSYVALKTRLIFDPPTTSAVMESNKALINEMECRLNMEVDRGKIW